jgi:hypothetical protein
MKAGIYVKGLKRHEQNNNRNIKLSFWFLIVVAIFVFCRRLLFPGFYRNLLGMFY